MKLVAKYADACNLFAGADMEELGRKMDILKGHCDTVGRNYNEIEKTALDRVNLAADGTSIKEMINRCKQLSQAGIQHVIFNMPNVATIKPLELIGKEVIPAVAGL